MKVLFIQDNLLNESLALTDAAGLLRSNGHEIELLVEDEEPNLSDKLISLKPDMIVITD